MVERAALEEENKNGVFTVDTEKYRVPFVEMEFRQLREVILLLTFHEKGDPVVRGRTMSFLWGGGGRGQSWARELIANLKSTELAFGFGRMA